jgi:hypothetical protein
VGRLRRRIPSGATVGVGLAVTPGRPTAESALVEEVSAERDIWDYGLALTLGWRTGQA